MASEFQRAKLTTMFAAFDTDRNGCLDRDDFQDLAERWHRLPRVAADPELTAQVTEVMLAWWERLSAAADRDNDGRVDLDEILAMVDRPPAMLDAVNATADAVFDAVDEDGDGRISPAEHHRLVNTWHGRAIDTADVFEVLDRDGDGFLGRSEFALLWAQFWISDNPADPGNLLCGPVPAARA
ncbi:EF-hand domain-containing protein [Kitasatospora cheerisanensis]|uniref:Calcium sensor EFh n=1 Tax=Kitasatospora cheerisanensis KCTC 2395 TaxID=1348663 RepID=A0A066YL42_9ACTN|nr:EF-hand domain-containing protein [Kitasatospora cheerisanensis]KDN80649.1 calcium sensor EFh [Kitasatospora cheerisanensis KCTC 2395]